MKNFVLGLNYWAHSAGIAERCACTPFIDKALVRFTSTQSVRILWWFRCEIKIFGGAICWFTSLSKNETAKIGNCDFDLESGDREPHPECKNIKFLYLSINFLTPNSFHHSSILHLRTCRGVTEHQSANQLVTVKSSQQILDCFVIVMSE